MKIAAIMGNHPILISKTRENQKSEIHNYSLIFMKTSATTPDKSAPFYKESPITLNLKTGNLQKLNEILH